MIERLDIFPTDLSIDQIREIGGRAAKEKTEAQAKADEIIAQSRKAIKRADEILSKEPPNRE